MREAGDQEIEREPDPADHASQVEQLLLRDQLEAQAIRAARTPKLAPSGVCQNHHCAEEFPAGDNRVFCDSRCAAEYERANHFKRAA